MMMFESMIESSILTYGAEIRGWKKQNEEKRVQEKYLRWVLGMDRETPGCIVREETKSEECRIVTECWKEKKKNTEKKEREKYVQRNGYASEEVERMRAKGKWVNVELRERDKDTDNEERKERIKESRYNREYERCMRKFRSTWGERVQVKEKLMVSVDVGTRREKPGSGRKERKEGAECAMRRDRQLNTCGMDVAK
ncbi:hypothetical protein MTP99_014013 [Tenebrio molitor]|nr:hypothetical protein MTP99_014013 [Tenebrio molitor]